MMKNSPPENISRRRFLRLAGGTVAAAAFGSYLLPKPFGKTLQPTAVKIASAADPDPDLFLAGTDGWMSLPGSPAIAPFHPDDLAPSPFNAYIFGFRNITGMTAAQIGQQKMKAQHNAPLFWTQQEIPFHVKLTNLGLAMRPDLVDAHTLHWHGFRNAIPFFDGEPSGSVSVPMGREFTYVYNAHDPGTYMYHCHVEDVEHVQMGMTGLVFVRPVQDGTTYEYPAGSGKTYTKFAYNDGNGLTGFDREFAMFLS